MTYLFVDSLASQFVHTVFQKNFEIRQLNGIEEWIVNIKCCCKHRLAFVLLKSVATGDRPAN